jgi:DNA-binding transcriptional LysR family regulator
LIEVAVKWNDRIGRRVKLHDLHIFMTVAEVGGMGKAAERLAISQPSISKAIADLERAIGYSLLDRTPRGVECTDYGKTLLRRGIGAFDELRQGIRDIESLADPTLGEIRVGSPEAVAVGFLSEVIARFARKFPRVTVNVIPANNMSHEFRILRDRSVDFLLGGLADPFVADDLMAEPLYQDRTFILSGRSGKWARRRKIDLAELINEPWVLAPESIFNSVMVEAFQARGLGVPRIGARTYTVHQRLKLIATNQFVGAESGQILRFNGKQFSLVKLPVAMPVRTWSVGVVTLKNRANSPVVENFLGYVRDLARSLAS